MTFAWPTLEDACAAVWQEGKARTADDFARRVRLLNAEAQVAVADALVRAVTLPLYTSDAPTVEWVDDKPWVRAGGKPVVPAIWDGEPDTYYLDPINSHLVEMVRRAYGGTPQRAMLTITEFDRHNKRDELFCMAVVALHLGDAPEYDHNAVLAWWQAVTMPHTQLTLFDEVPA
jgi:hypothetical protein